MIKFLFSILFLTLALNAEPTLAEAKAAVQANPALLDTPEAKAVMLDKGISIKDVMSNLDAQGVEIQTGKTQETKLNNIEDIKDIDVDYLSTDMEDENKTLDIKTEKLKNERLNPFVYKDDIAIRKDLNSKKQNVKESKLKRYSMNFYTNKNVIDSSSLPTPDNYIVSSGDELKIYVYGDRDQVYTPVVDSSGNIELPYIGPVHIGGMKYIDAKEYLVKNLKSHFKLSDFNININKYSTIQVTLVGDVKNPGLYNLSSFSTVKDLLIEAKGTRETASVRDIVVKRNSKIVARLDFYDLLFKGKAFGQTLLKHGDIVVINKAKKLVSIDGYVKNSAIFELKNYETLATLINYAGGMKPDASKADIKVDRFSDNSKIETFNISYKEAKKFKMKDGDKVYIYPLDFSATQNVYVYGNVIRPGSYRLNGYRTLNRFFVYNLKDGKKKFFLPNTYFNYGVIKRYSDDLKYETKSFNLDKVISGDQIVDLKPQDKIYIFSKVDISSNSYVTTKGSTLLKPGKLQYYAGMTLEDAINASGTNGVVDDKVRLTRYDTDTLMPKTTFYSLKKDGDTKLKAYDEIEVFDFYNTHILKPVRISGEVIKPIQVYYENNMSVQDLINVAGGLTNEAYSRNIEIVRYSIDKDENRKRNILKISMENKRYADIKLQPYDEVRIFKIPKWSERKVVEVKGQVRFPGVYTIETGEKLSSVLRRAGGFTDEAFIEGAVFTRESIRKNQVQQYNSSLARIKRQLAIYNAMPANSKKSGVSTNSVSTLTEVMAEAEKYQPLGRISMVLDSNISKIQESEFNIVLKDKDSITIPSRIDTVTVFGEVFNPTSFVYTDDIDAEDYIKLASGYTRGADKDSVYIIHANGTSEPAVSGWGPFKTYAEVNKGDTIVVPMYIQEYNQLELWEGVSKILASFAVTAATLNTLGVF